MLRFLGSVSACLPGVRLAAAFPNLTLFCCCLSMLSGEADGNIKILSMTKTTDGDIGLLQQKKFSPGFVTGIQWFPKDNGMFCVAYNSRVVLVDTNTFCICESHNFSQNQLFWCDWNELDGNLIAVAASASTIRLIDVRSGGSLHSLTLSSPLGVKDHSVTRVLWDKSDSEALFAGDSSGCIHVYDIRSTRAAIEILSPDNHIFQTVTCLQHTPDGMCLITSHGMFNFFTLWQFRSKRLVNSGVHFEMPVRRRGGNEKKRNISGLVRTQLFMTSDLMFSPVADGAGEVLVHDLVTGARLRTLDSGRYAAVAGRKENVVSGTRSELPILYSAGRCGIKVWGPKIDRESESNPLHQDDWSDGE